MNYDEVYDKAIALLSVQNHFEAQLRQKLLKREYDEDLVEEVLLTLNKKGYLNDFENAIRYIESKKNDWSIYHIRGKLYQKGVSNLNINLAFEEVEIDEFETALKLSKRKLKLGFDEEIPIIEYEQAMKLCRYLSSKGFAASTIRAIKEHIT